MNILRFLLDLLFGINARAELKALDQSLAVIKFDNKGKIITANQNFLNAMGYSLDEIKGKHHSMFVEEGYKNSQAYTQFWKDLAAGKFQAAEFKRIAKDGKEIWIQASYNPITDFTGKVHTVVKYASDITKAKLTSFDHEGQINAIHRSQAVIEFDLNGNILTANENFLNRMGYSLTEVSGKHHSIFVEAEYKKSEDYKTFWESLRAGKYNAGEFKRVAKDGSDVWIQASYNPILDADGVAVKVVKYATDITNRVNIQKAISNYVVDSNALSSELSSYIIKVAGASEELITSINEISQNTSSAATMTNQAVSTINKTDDLINSLKHKSTEIGSILKVVGEIADQTNLLALNATIEASRAGDAGKGFSVVAHEVKELATKTAQATGNIQAHISSIQEEVNLALSSMSDATKSIQDVNNLTLNIASAMEEQTTVTNEIGDSMQVASQQVATVTGNVSNIQTEIEKL